MVNPYGPAARKMAIARMLMANANQPIQNPWNAISNLANTYMGMRMAGQAGDLYDKRLKGRTTALSKALNQMQPKQVMVGSDSPLIGATPKYKMQSDMPGAIQTLAAHPDLADTALLLQGQEAAARRKAAASDLAHTRAMEIEEAKAGFKQPKTVRTKAGIYELDSTSATGLGRRLGDSPPPSSMTFNTGGDIISRTADRMDESYTLARDTGRNMETINRIAAALPEATTGPGSSALSLLDRIGVTLGVRGQNVEQRLVQTRKVIQGLSKLTLAGRAKLRGQGQVTEGEQALLAKAESGEIGDMTQQEIKTILDVAARVEKAKYDDHVDDLSRFSKMPGFAPYKDIYTVGPFTPYKPPVFNRKSQAPVLKPGVADALQKYGR